jgi:curved DNA-binding protein
LKDPYSILGLPRTASVEDAKKAFKTIAKTCHPDLFPNDPTAETRFKEINAAYDAIEHPEPVNPFAGAAGFPPGGFPFTGGGGAGIFDDIFAQFHRSRNNDYQFQCQMTLEEAFTGKDIEIGVPTPAGGTSKLQVKIPPGVDHGMRLCVQQGGDHSNQSARPGDLYITVIVVPHQQFTRHGTTLKVTFPVSAIDVLLQRPITVRGIDGQTIKATIPPNWDTARSLRIAGQGMPVNSGRGDLLIDLLVQFPTLNAQQQANLSRMAL